MGRGSICILYSVFWILDSKLPWASLGRDGRSVFCILYSVSLVEMAFCQVTLRLLTGKMSTHTVESKVLSLP